jgi:glycosyltransferase involved in cell wall biosynthesis
MRLAAGLIGSMTSATHEVVIIGPSRHMALAQRCGLKPSGWLAPPGSVPFGGRRDLARFVAALSARGRRPDVIHAWSTRSAALATLAAPEVARLATLHVGPFPGFESRYHARVLRRNPAALLAASAVIARECRAAGFDRRHLALFPPAIDAAAAGPFTRSKVRARWQLQLGLDPGTFVVGLLSEPIRWPDVRAAATSIARVTLAGRNIRLLVHPRAARRIEAQRFLREVDMEDFLIFDDRAAEPWTILRGLDAAYVSAGWRPGPEPSMLPLLWSLACGVPAITELNDATRSIIDDEVNGLLVDPHDVNAASDRMVRLYDDRALGKRLAEAGASLIRDTYDMKSYTMRLKHAYDLLLTRRLERRRAAPDAMSLAPREQASPAAT